MHRGDSNLLVLVVLSAVVLGQPTANVLADDKLTSGSRVRTKVTETQAEYPESMIMRDKEQEETVQHLESSLLKMFGLSKRPRPKGKIQVPLHMIELYKIQAGLTGDVDIDTDRRRIKRHPGNTIRSFYSEDSSVEDGESSSEELAHNKVKLFFNVSHIPEHEALKGAELRLFRRRANDSFINLQNNQELTESYPSISKPHRIDIYEIIRPGTPTEESISRLIDTRYIKDLTKSKWESFDIHPAVNKWRNKPQTNFGLEVHFTDHKGNKPHLKHVRLRRSAPSVDTDWHVEQPLLLAYSDDGKGEYSRTKRNVQAVPEDDDHDDDETEEVINQDGLTEEEKRARRREERRRKKQEARGKKNRKKNQCKRQPLHVDFKDVGWADWIIAPPGYDAFFCHGECPFFLADHLNATNHAIVQTLVNSVDPQAAPSPCCVPTELSDIAMLYLDEFEKVVLKNYQDMVVLACGCR